MRQAEEERLTLIGGGITGLVTAYLAAKAGAKVVLVEKNEEPGGLLRTFPIGGSRLEFYYHHFFNHDAEINWLINELGLSEKLIYRKSSMGIFRKGKIHPFDSPLDLLSFPPMNILDKLRFGLSGLYMGKLADWRKFEGVPARSWLRQWAGEGSAASVWDPMLDIKFGPYADQVPLAWMIGRLKQRLGSRDSAGQEELGYLEGSLQVLLDALLDALKEMGVEIRSGEALTGLDIQGSRLKAIETNKGRIEGGNFIFTLPGIYLYPLLEKKAEGLAKKLRDIRYFGALCTILETDRPLSDTYWLNIADPGFPFGGIIEHTNFIPPGHYGGKHITYLSRYFAPGDPLSNMGKEEILKVMTSPLPRIYPDFDPKEIKKAHVFRTATAATVCDLHFSQKVPSCKTEIEQLFLVNMAHIYPDERSTNNSIRIAAEACKVMGWDSLAEKVPYGVSLSGKIGFEG